MMISKDMNTRLNAQIAMEFGAAYKYLAMACNFEDMGLKIMAARFRQQFQEETQHALKILAYVQEVGGSVKLDQISTPKNDYQSLEEIVAAALESELQVTKAVNDLVSAAEAEKDYATRSFLQWFVDEQVEEVSSMTDLLDLVKLAGNNPLQVEMRVRHQMMADKH